MNIVLSTLKQPEKKDINAYIPCYKRTMTMHIERSMMVVDGISSTWPINRRFLSIQSHFLDCPCRHAFPNKSPLLPVSSPRREYVKHPWCWLAIPSSAMGRDHVPAGPHPQTAAIAETPRRGTTSLSLPHHSMSQRRRPLQWSMTDHQSLPVVGQEAEHAIYSGDRRRRAGTGQVVRPVVVDVV